MKYLEKHSRTLHVLIERLPKLRALQNILELYGIDTQPIEDSFVKGNNLSIEIQLKAYTDTEDSYSQKICTKVIVSPKYNVENPDIVFVSLKYIENIISNSKIIHKEHLNDN